MKKAIVTGAGGFLGFALSKKLLENCVKVYGISTNESKIEELKHYNNFTPIASGFDNYDNISKNINDTDIDVIFHCAWQGTSTKEYQDFDIQKNNISVIPKLVNLMLDVKCKKFIFVGSCFQYKMLEKNDTQFVDNIYGVFKETFSKLIKIECIKNNIEYNDLMFTIIFGEGDYSRKLANVLMLKAVNGETPTLIKGDNLYDLIYIDDAVDGMLAIYGKGVNLKSYYLGSRNLKTFKELVINLFSIIDQDINLSFGGYEDKSYIDYSKINLGELYTDTGFECKCDFKESIIKTSEWLKNNQ